MVRGFVAGRMFFIGVLPFNTKTKVAPVSATACVAGIAGFFGGVTMPHILCCFVVFDVMAVLSSSSTTAFWVVYKVGSAPNDFTHLTTTCSAPHRQ